MPNINRFFVGSFLLLLVLWIPSASAELIVDLGFDVPPYATAGGIAGQGPAETGFTGSGNWFGTGTGTRSVASRGLAYDGWASGDDGSFFHGNVASGFRQTTRNIDDATFTSDPTELWMGFVTERQNRTATGSSYVIFSSETTGSITQSISMGIRADDLFLQVDATGTGDNTNFFDDGAVGTADVTDDQLFLAKVEINPLTGANDNYSIWLNPDLSLGQAGLGVANLTGSAAFWETGSQLRNVRVARAGAGTGNFLTDEIRIGTSFNSVTAVPEPSSLVLLGLAAGGAAVVRRRRSRQQ